MFSAILPLSFSSRPHTPRPPGKASRKYVGIGATDVPSRYGWSSSVVSAAASSSFSASEVKNGPTQNKAWNGPAGDAFTETTRLYSEAMFPRTSPAIRIFRAFGSDIEAETEAPATHRMMKSCRLVSQTRKRAANFGKAASHFHSSAGGRVHETLTYNAITTQLTKTLRKQLTKTPTTQHTRVTSVCSYGYDAGDAARSGVKIKIRPPKDALQYSFSRTPRFCFGAPKLWTEGAPGAPWQARLAPNPSLSAPCPAPCLGGTRGRRLAR